MKGKSVCDDCKLKGSCPLQEDEMFETEAYASSCSEKIITENAEKRVFLKCRFCGQFFEVKGRDHKNKVLSEKEQYGNNLRIEEE